MGVAVEIFQPVDGVHEGGEGEDEGVGEVGRGGETVGLASS